MWKMVAATLKQYPENRSLLLWWDRVCKGLIVLGAIVMMTCVIIQALLQFPVIRHYLIPVEKLEGIPYEWLHKKQ